MTTEEGPMTTQPDGTEDFRTDAGTALLVRLIYVEDIGNDQSQWPFLEDVSDDEELELRQRILAIEAEAVAAERKRLLALLTPTPESDR
jgi:hypothetical protein